MDFEQIYNTIQPYLEGGSLAAIVTFIITVLAKLASCIKTVKENSNVTELFKKALPNDLTVSIEKLTRSEIDKLTAEIKADVIKPFTEQTVLLQDLCAAICSLRSVPEDMKKKIAEHCDTVSIPMQETIKLSINKGLEVTQGEKQKIYVD